MLLNYIKLAFRLLLRNPFFSFINILGLSLGFAAFLVLSQYSSNELVSDQFHNEFKNKFRLVFDWQFKDDQGIFTEHRHALFGPHFPKILASEYDEFGKYTRLYHQAQFSLKSIGDHGKDIFLSRLNATQQQLAFKEENLAYADPNFFEFFSIPLLEGSSDQVLKEPSSIVLSETMARKYFGDENALHNLLLVNDSIVLKVTGIFNDLPNNTHLTFDALISSERISRQLNGLVEGAMLYFQVKSNSNRADLDAKVDVSAKKFLAPNLTRLNINPNDIKVYFQPLDEIAFSKLTGDVHQQRSRTILITLQVVAIVILITAWINYLNLVIYANSKRMKELGVRKTSGARSSDFVLQFIVESLIINALSILAAITLVQTSKAPLEHLFQVHLSSGGGISTSVLLVMTFISLSGIIITGLYPALKVINKSARNVFSDDHRHNFYLGKSLTIFQFSVAIILTISVFAIHSQLHYVLNKDLGLKRDEVIVLDLPEDPGSYRMSNLEAFLTQLPTLSGVSNFAVSSSVPGDQRSDGICLQRRSSSEFINTDSDGVDERFLSFFNIKLLAGRNFVNGDPGNEDAIIVSRNLLQRLGITQPEDAVGQTVLVEETEWTHDMKPAKIIGVIEDYDRKPLLAGKHYGWLKQDGVALTYHNNVEKGNTLQKISLIIHYKNFDETLKQVENLYRQTFSKSLFHWYFLDDNVKKHYQQEKVARNQITLFALIAIGIACLGVLGMIANRAEERTKEIGVRKVLGASIQDVANILLSTTIQQMAIAVLVGIPAAHFLVHEYLLKYSDRIAIQWWHYLMPVFALLLILLLTTASTLRKAATTNPADSLRSE